MKRKALLLTIIISIILNISAISHAKTQNVPKTKSSSAIMVDLSTDKYLYKHNEDVKIQPGGFAKIMTAIVVLDHVKDISDTVTADINVISSYDYSFGHMGILAGEKLTIENLLNGMLIYDAGDAAEVLSSTVMSSRKDFIREMNNKAIEIGALNTKFTNPTGFPDKKQYSTTSDIYKITKYAMSNKIFKEIVGKSRYEMSATNKYTQPRYLDNKNKFMNISTTDKYYSPKAKGIKSSYIDDTNCGVALQYETDTMQLLILTAGAPYDGEINYAYEDAASLIKYGLDYYTNVKVVSEGEIFAEIELKNGKNEDRVLLEAKNDIFINLPKHYDESKIKKKIDLKSNIKAPLKEGEVLGTVKIYYDGEEYISTELYAPKTIEEDKLKGFLNKTKEILTSPTLLVTMGIILIIFVWSLLLFNRKKSYKIDKID